MTAAQFAEKIGISPSSLSHILSGRNNPSLEVVMKIHKACDYISLDWLLYGEGQMETDVDSDNNIHYTPSLFDENSLFTPERPASPEYRKENEVKTPLYSPKDLVVTQNIKLHANYVLIKLTHANPLPEMLPGQFAEIRIDGSNTTFLRRPISINYVDKTTNEVWFLVQLVGDGTRKLATVKQGDIVNVVMPLGNGFTMPRNVTKVKPLLVGGGVGTAPMLMLGAELVKMGCTPAFLLGARSSKDLLQLENFEKLGEVYTTTEDGSMGEKGYVTQHSVLHTDRFDMIYTCGPKPMMVSVAKYAKAHGIECEVSLENRMACGVGACLCCVENTDEGHLCVCKEGPVFNIKKLLWQI